MVMYLISLLPNGNFGFTFLSAFKWIYYYITNTNVIFNTRPPQLLLILKVAQTDFCDL